MTGARRRPGTDKAGDLAARWQRTTVGRPGRTPTAPPAPEPAPPDEPEADQAAPPPAEAPATRPAEPRKADRPAEDSSTEGSADRPALDSPTDGQDAAAPPRRKRKRAKSAPPQTPNHARRLNITVPDELATLARAAVLDRTQAQDRWSLSRLVMEAYYQHLPALREQATARPTPPTSDQADPLARAARRTLRGGRARPAINAKPLQLWVYADQRGDLEAAVNAGLAPSVSALVTAALELELKPSAARPRQEPEGTG